MSKSDQNYDEINQIFKKISMRTLHMKTNNVKLLNKIGSEMNILLEKVQEIVRFCISDRNDFVKEIELIQFDFVQLGKKIDQQFSMQSQSNQTENQIQKNKSVIQTILDSDSSDNESPKQLPISSAHNLMIPDTCMPQCEMEKTKKPSKQLIIRDTIDSNYDEIFADRDRNKLQTINENSIINESFEKEIGSGKNFDETCLQEVISDMVQNNKKLISDSTKIHLLKASQSTPLAIKKKLQEHGLLDLTNSPFETPKKNSNLSTPVKYVQSKFTLESPRDSKTPAKFVLSTPTKSPSIFVKKPNFQASSGNDEKSFNVNQNDSFDFSFEFREQAKNKSSNSSKCSNARNSSGSTSIFSNNSAKSPKIKNSQNNRNKRFKQLTSDSNESSKSGENKIISYFARKSNEQNIKDNLVNSTDLDETCLPNDDFLNNIKSEPISHSQKSNSNGISDSFVSIFSNREPKQSNKVGFKSFILRKMGFIKGQYKQKNEKEQRNYLENEAKDEQSNAHTRSLADDYFSDFDKVPKKKDNGSNIKHLEVVRKHDERKKLPTWICKECEAYWNTVPEELRPKRMENSCRHRAKYQPPPTPEHYWSIAFPNTQECIERGYGGIVAKNDKEDDISKRSRRKRPLKLIGNIDKNSEDEIKDLDFGD